MNEEQREPQRILSYRAYMEFKNSTVTQGSYERDYDQGCEAEGRERERERSHDEETRREREETRRSVEGIRLGRDCSAVVQMDKVQECILSLKEILGSNLEEHSLGEELHNHHHRAAKILGEDEHVARAVVGKLSEEMSGHCDDAICRWLYDTFQTRDPYLQTVVLRYVPIPLLFSVFLLFVCTTKIGVLYQVSITYLLYTCIYTIDIVVYVYTCSLCIRAWSYFFYCLSIKEDI